MERKTKIIATLGPAVASLERIIELVGAGVDVARLNFSHGEERDHRAFVEWVQAASQHHGRPVAIMQDIQGPKIRVGEFPNGQVTLESSQVVVVRDCVTGSEIAPPGEIFIRYLDRVSDLEPGDLIQLCDGMVTLEVTQRADGVRTRVLQGGVVKAHKGAAFPGASIDIPVVTEKDRHDLELGRELGVDLVAASFVRSAADVKEVASLAGVPIIAKIESMVGYRALDEILGEALGAMVARGDLGVELSITSLPMVQKDILARTNLAGRISITATEMLESMTVNPRPTRAEATDVANAVLDGTDAVMLSAETAAGAYPVRAVQVMDALCREAEESVQAASLDEVGFLSKEPPFPAAIAMAAVAAATNLGIETIVGFTESGGTPRLLSKYRPSARIVAFTTRPETLRRMAMFWGVVPHLIDPYETLDQAIEQAEAYMVAEGKVGPGGGLVMVAGVPPNRGATTNLLKVHEVGGPSAATRLA